MNQIVSATIDPLIIIYRVSSFGFFIDSSSLFPKRRFISLLAPRINRRWGSGLKPIFFENFYWREYPQLSLPGQNVCSTIRVLSTTAIVFTERSLVLDLRLITFITCTTRTERGGECNIRARRLVKIMVDRQTAVQQHMSSHELSSTKTTSSYEVSINYLVLTRWEARSWTVPW
jgi:hypothetical protein